MRRIHILIIFGVLFVGGSCLAQPKNKELQEFVMDLSSANIKLRGKLKLVGDYKGNLSSLTYDLYIELLRENETRSNEGITAIIVDADNHIFVAKENSFLIAIYSKKLNAVLYDDSNTSFIDSILVLDKNQKVPDLVEFIRKTGY